MKKNLPFVLFLFLLGNIAHAQQLPIFTQYRESVSYLNPAALNTSYFTHQHNLSFGISHRSQWVGFEGGPQTQLVKGEYLYDNNNAFSLLSGGYLLHDKTDPLSMTGVYGKIASVFTGNPESGGFSVGLSGGMVQYRVDLTDVAIRDKNDLEAQNSATWYTDFGLGFYFYKKRNTNDYFYAGLSVPQLFGLNVELENEERTFSTRRVQHVYGLVGYYRALQESTFVEVSSWAKYAPQVPVNIDFNVRYQFHPSFWVGTGGSTSGAVHLETGMVLDWNAGLENSAIRIGYAYNRYFTSYGPSNLFGATHEINLSYSIDTQGR